MAEVVNSLFGITPESLMAEREKALQTQAMQYAQADPFQRATAAIYSGANRLGGAVGGLLGAQDPEMMRIQQRQGVLQNLDLTNPESLKQGIQTAMQNKDYQLVSELTNRYQQRTAAELAARKTEAEITAKTAEKTTNEMKNAGGYADTKAQRGTPEWTAAYNEKLDELTSKADKALAYGPEAERVAKGKFGKSFNQLTQQEAAQVDAELTRRGVIKAQAGASKPVDVASIIKEIGTKEDIKDKAATWKAAGDAYKMQVPMIAKLQEVKEALPKTFTGSFSDTALQFGKGLSALGIPVDRTKLANTEYMNSVSSQVLQTIARNFPGSLAVKEMDQLVKSKFNSQQQIETVSRILSDLQTEIEAGTKSYEQLAKLPEAERYTKDLNYLTGQNFNKLKRYRALEQKANSLAAGQKMSKQEVEEARKLQSELGVQ